jgi:hypothetical protein
MQQTYQNQGQGQFYPQQQQQQYQQQQFQQVPNQVQYQVPPPQQVIQGPVLTSGGGGPIADLESFRAKYEIKPSYVPVLQKLALYRSILICDDSGSMNESADPDTSSRVTRWEELQQMVKIIIEGHAVVGSFCDIYFINRPGVLHVTNWNQCAPLFMSPPAGFTNTCAVLEQIQKHEVGIDMGKPIIIHLLTDGHPTDAGGRENYKQLENMIINRTFKAKTYFSVTLCTSDEEVQNMYHKLNKTGGVDMSLNYRGEKKEILGMRGSKFPFSFGDYATKVMVGSFDKTMNNLDKPPGAGCACIIS